MEEALLQDVHSTSADVGYKLQPVNELLMRNLLIRRESRTAGAAVSARANATAEESVAVEGIYDLSQVSVVENTRKKKTRHDAETVNLSTCFSFCVFSLSSFNGTISIISGGNLLASFLHSCGADQQTVDWVWGRTPSGAS